MQRPNTTVGEHLSQVASAFPQILPLFMPQQLHAGSERSRIHNVLIYILQEIRLKHVLSARICDALSVQNLQDTATKARS